MRWGIIGLGYIAPRHLDAIAATGGPGRLGGEGLPVKVFILGCAKSGTTLLLNLFHGFADVEVVYGAKGTEVSLDEICKRQVGPRRAAVGKRVWDTVLSDEIPEGKAQKQLRQIEEFGIRAVVIQRDGRDVVLSDDGYVPPSRWCHCVEQAALHSGPLGAVMVRYEDILEAPGKTQDRIAAALGLSVLHRWDQYPAWLPADASFPRGDNYRPRPLDASRWRGPSSDAWKAKVRPEEMGRFTRCLEMAGYA